MINDSMTHGSVFRLCALQIVFACLAVATARAGIAHGGYGGYGSLGGGHGGLVGGHGGAGLSGGLAAGAGTAASLQGGASSLGSGGLGASYAAGAASAAGAAGVQQIVSGGTLPRPFIGASTLPDPRAAIHSSNISILEFRRSARRTG